MLVDGVISIIVVKKGEDATVTCSPQDTGDLYLWIKPDNLIISPSFQYDEDEYGLVGTNLIIKNVDFTYGGRYNCYLLGGDGNPSGTELIVLGKCWCLLLHGRISNKHETLNQCRFNFGPASQKVGQQ